MRYEIALKKTEEGYAVWCPALKGCWSQGDTAEDAIENIKDAIREYLAVIHERIDQERSTDEEMHLAEVSL
jgi:predicted RNase H-like HicB family nuclease